MHIMYCCLPAAIQCMYISITIACNHSQRLVVLLSAQMMCHSASSRIMVMANTLVHTTATCTYIHTWIGGPLGHTRVLSVFRTIIQWRSKQYRHNRWTLRINDVMSENVFWYLTMAPTSKTKPKMFIMFSKCVCNVNFEHSLWRSIWKNLSAVW